MSKHPSTTSAEARAALPADSSPLSDEELFRQAQQGDFEAFAALVERLQPRIYGLAYRFLGQAADAEDVTQQTFLSVLEHLDQFRGQSRVATWVLQIATNHALKLLRKRRGLPTVPLETAPPGREAPTPLPHPQYIARWRDNPADLAQRAEVRRLLEEALAELDEKYRLVFLLRDLEGLSIRETAAVLGLSEANVKVRLLRARLQLRERLTRALGDEATRVVPEHAD